MLHRSKRRDSRGSATPGTLLAPLILLCAALALACGGGGDPAETTAPQSAEAEPELGRYRVQVFRTSTNPQFFRFDTSTGEVTFSPILEAKVFRPMTTEAPPGAEGWIRPGRFAFEIVPGRGGAAILRTDSVSGRVWILHLTAKAEWAEIETHRDSGDAPKPPRRPVLPERKYSEQDQEFIDQVKKKIVLPKDQPQPTPKLDALLYMLDSGTMTPELRVWAVGELAEHYPGEARERLLAALEDPDAMVVVAAIEAVDPAADPRYATALKGLEDHSDESVSSAARTR